MAERKQEQAKEKGAKKKAFPKWIIPIIVFALIVSAIIFMVSQIVQFTYVGDHNGDSFFSAMIQGYDAGKKEGLSAKDTEQKMKNTIKEMKKLEVLAANVKIPEYHSVGQKYAAMYLFRGSAVFTVDLTKANIIVNSADIQVLLPKPECELRIDHKETERIKSTSALFFNGSAEDGLETYLHKILNEVKQNSTKTISNYLELSEMAKQNAKLQLEEIIENICGDGIEITFRFIEE